MVELLNADKTGPLYSHLLTIERIGIGSHFTVMLNMCKYEFLKFFTNCIHLRKKLFRNISLLQRSQGGEVPLKGCDSFIIVQTSMHLPLYRAKLSSLLNILFV